MINQNRDFSKVYRNAKSYVSLVLVTYVLKKKNGPLRYGITTSKKVGGAVQRNRARRIIKESFRLLNLDNSLSYDIIFVARGKTSRVSMNVVMKSMKKHFVESGLIDQD